MSIDGPPHECAVKTAPRDLGERLAAIKLEALSREASGTWAGPACGDDEDAVVADAARALGWSQARQGHLAAAALWDEVSDGAATAGRVTDSAGSDMDDQHHVRDVARTMLALITSSPRGESGACTAGDDD